MQSLAAILNLDVSELFKMYMYVKSLVSIEFINFHFTCNCYKVTTVYKLNLVAQAVPQFSKF